MEIPESELFRDAFYTHYPTVRRKLIALVRDEAAAEDLAQEVFLRLYRNPPDDLNVLGAWLHRVLTRIGYDYLNKKSRERSLQEKQERHVMSLGGEEPSGEEAVLQKLDHEEVQQWLGELSERDRQLLLLRYSGYSYAEIAEQLQVRQPLVGTLIHRAAAKLKRHAKSHAQFE
ncbi:sigma-70 family RNA polymerase sigma factor [Paenibacillus piri]|uniref:Sigma-70 family RNA polymerase sigma factor n=1 Tax=Paenibacillus piri TaxID=2547395 RepID=A0A4R5KY42_9BACL|nr:sigma-70 family RNA polymerase sigma factor [Paenibacillus piri]TDG00136.1 sigma-70 family RNA polymerase sigma factor [Paenibacillus piri]